jgi:hypothetical protein
MAWTLARRHDHVPEAVWCLEEFRIIKGYDETMDDSATGSSGCGILPVLGPKTPGSSAGSSHDDWSRLHFEG